MTPACTEPISASALVIAAPADHPCRDIYEVAAELARAAVDHTPDAACRYRHVTARADTDGKTTDLYRALLGTLLLAAAPLTYVRFRHEDRVRDIRSRIRADIVDIETSVAVAQIGKLTTAMRRRRSLPMDAVIRPQRWLHVTAGITGAYAQITAEYLGRDTDAVWDDISSTLRSNITAVPLHQVRLATATR